MFRLTLEVPTGVYGDHSYPQISDIEHVYTRFYTVRGLGSCPPPLQLVNFMQRSCIGMTLINGTVLYCGSVLSDGLY